MNVQANPKTMTATKRSELRDFLALLERDHPNEILRIGDTIDPAAFEATAILANLEQSGVNPMVLFEKPLNLLGQPSAFPLVTNIYSSRRRDAIALGLQPHQDRLDLSLEYSRREQRRTAPVRIARDEAPVKQVVKTGDRVDLREFPIVRHHRMDPAPYVDMAPIMRDPEMGHYNIAFLRTMYKGPRKLGIHMSPRHNWQMCRKNELNNRPTPTVIVVSHHPAFFLGALNVAPFGTDDYEVLGAMMNEPVRLVPSETWGEDFMVPADAEILIEGEIPPNVREVEGPFGEFPGTYGPQRLRWVIDVKAITHRRDAIYQDVFVGHADDWVMGAIPKEGALFNRIKGVVPGVKAVHLPNSGVGRFNCYISIDKRVDGESKQAALIALGEVDFVKNVIVVDGDIDPYNEQDVMYAVATRVQADQDVDIIKNVKGNTLDPSQVDDIMTAKMIIDATRPMRRPFASRLDVPLEVRQRFPIERWLKSR
ncbi:MAG: UbiD family decarboxylase [Hyphomicrobiales bacterium]|nr:UbiD family decarboxylase [Hyphomicrobiales bacterium]